MLVAGVDPGLGGALAWYNTETGAVEVVDMPVLRLVRGGKSKGEIDAHALAGLFWKRHTGHIYLEHVTPMPSFGEPDSQGRPRRQGASSGFAFGKGFGVVIGVIAAIGVPMTLVRANKWKNALGVPAAKDGARSRASQLLPQAADQWPRVKDDGRAEASLLALYGVRDLAGIARAA
jgi:crossover junction endodeoxyribonuclease RuvC